MAQKRTESEFLGFKDLIVYQKAFVLAMDVFQLTKCFPKNEVYGLTDQLRRSTRSIGSNLAEAYPRRKYFKYFVSKLIDAQSEACETIHWLDMSHACEYIDETSHRHYKNLTYEIQRMIEKIIQNPSKFCPKPQNKH